MTDQIFVILSIFLMVEILSQLFKLELIGKVFVQFYVLISHLFIAIALLTYETREVVYYFISLIAIINSLRFVFYKVPMIKENRKVRFVFDFSVIVLLIYLILSISNFLPIEIGEVFLDDIGKFSVVSALGIVLFYEMFQRASGVGLDVNDYLPDTLFSYLIVTIATLMFIGTAIAVFVVDETLYLNIITLLPFVFAGIVFFMIAITLVNENARNRYSVLYVMPTFLMMIIFFSIFS